MNESVSGLFNKKAQTKKTPTDVGNSRADKVNHSWFKAEIDIPRHKIINQYHGPIEGWNNYCIV
jgi:hypothetical protein